MVCARMVFHRVVSQIIVTRLQYDDKLFLFNAVLSQLNLISFFLHVFFFFFNGAPDDALDSHIIISEWCWWLWVSKINATSAKWDSFFRFLK